MTGEIPSTKVYEDEHTMAFLDINPVNPGHTLVVPKEHYKNIFDLPRDVLCQLAETVQKVSIAVEKGVEADGIVVTSNNNEAAGQVIEHAHTHVVPRHRGDGIKHWPGSPYKEGEEKEVAEKIKSAF